MIGLAVLVSGHRGALDYDLMTLAGRTLDDVFDGRMTPRALLHFVLNLDTSSRTWRDINPDRADEATWLDGSLTSVLLARVCDEISDMQWVYLQSLSKCSVQRPSHVPTPWTKDDSRHIGRDPIPISEFNEWWDGEAS